MKKKFSIVAQHRSMSFGDSAFVGKMEMGIRAVLVGLVPCSFCNGIRFAGYDGPAAAFYGR